MQKNSDFLFKKIIAEYGLKDFDNIKKFILENPLDLKISDLSRISEMSNGLQESTAAYYTDPKTVITFCQYLPEFDKKYLRILEPSIGVGNILRQAINHYKDKVEYMECDVFDINPNSLELCKIFIQKEFGDLEKLKINYICDDFLSHKVKYKYDLVIGNPPFLKLKGLYKKKLRLEYNNSTANNSSAFFLDKSILLSEHVLLIMPKYFLHNADFSISREKLTCMNIRSIIDFGETGFKGILIETICLVIDTKSKNIEETTVVSVPRKISITQKQKEITQSSFPNWLIYIDEEFKQLASKMIFGIFTVFRDRQITSKILSSKGDVWVIKSKNIPRSGQEVSHIKEDIFIHKEEIKSLGVSKYFSRDDVFLSPNMTYYPRVVIKPKNCIVNGSVAIFELKAGHNILEEDLLFFASSEFESFYRVARNFSTRSLNIDNIAIYYFGRRKKDV